MPRVFVNGEERTLPEGATVADAVREAGGTPDGRGLAVALDGEVVSRGQWRSRELGEGEQIEVLHAVQGG